MDWQRVKGFGNGYGGALIRQEGSRFLMLAEDEAYGSMVGEIPEYLYRALMRFDEDDWKMQWEDYEE